MIYFDYNATSPLSDGVLQQMLPYFREFYGNPSSLHRIGRVSRDAIEHAREQVAQVVGVAPSQVCFTSGGTEANNLAIGGLGNRLPVGEVLVSAIEHPSVAQPLKLLNRKGWTVNPLNVDRQGLVKGTDSDFADPAKVRFVCCMIANNETGVIQDIPRIAAPWRDRGVPVVCDGVQALGKLSLDFNSMGVSCLSLSAHKIGGPKGVGALIVDKSVGFEPLLSGGKQERGLRGGTENVAAIVGFGVAAQLVQETLHDRVRHVAFLRERLEQGLKKIPAVTIFSEMAQRIPNTSMFGIAGTDGEMTVMELDRRGIAVSSGAACSSQDTDPSPVLLAMGVDAELARSAIRVSLGPENTADEIDQLVSAIRQAIPDESLQVSGY